VARTIKQLGAPNVIVAGNIKIDAPPPPVDPVALANLRTATEGRPILLAASTHPGEDALVAAAHAEIAKTIPALLTIIVPRHPDRGQALGAEMAGRGMVTERRSQTPLPSRDAQIYIADTIGELGTFYALAPVALIGGSLVEHGGQNPIEAIRHGAVVLTGPHHHNFREIYDELLAVKGAREVKSADDLATAVRVILSDPSEAAKLRTGAETALGRLGGALAKTVAALKPFLTNAGA
jgi:3-deoxy-D-manno-octulosonic-acid transferase